jgi:hypothetical protein
MSSCAVHAPQAGFCAAKQGKQGKTDKNHSAIGTDNQFGRFTANVMHNVKIYFARDLISSPQ